MSAMGWTGVAAYPSVCGYGCGVPIAVGDRIERTGEWDGRQYGHVRCPDTPAEAADRAALAAPRCGRCGLNHPGQC